MKRKRVSAFFAFAIFMSGLAGCSADSTSGTNEKDGNHSDDTVTIKFHTHGNEASYNWAHTIAAFEEEHPSIKVDLVILSEKGDTQEATQKLDLAAASGEQMDVLMFSDPASYAQRVHLGMVAPIDEFIEEEGYTMAEEYKVDTQMNGHYYALPGKFNPWYVLVNKDHFDEAGLEVPTDWTWDEFIEYAEALTTDDHYGVYFHGPQGDGWMEYLKLALASEEGDTEFIKADGTSNLDHPLFKKTLEMRVKMEKEDQSSVPYTDIISQKLHYRNQFFGQEASMIPIGSWMNTELGGTDQFPLDFNVGVAPYPKNDLSSEGYTPVTTDYMAVAANSDHKKEAYTFIRWYTTEGQMVQGKNVPSWNEVTVDDLGTIIDGILAETVSPEKVDRDALVHVLQHAQSPKMVAPVSYQAELYKVIGEEYEKLILDDQGIEKTLENMQTRTQEIIDHNQ
ncbi:ABC transporter substrate-binding protein [Shouchella clausii]|uniref:ABC transporter substrate-binding protein n=1 Tax=Shouchella clausii TaxID=79880 RepID=UPI000B965473|nr:sugar ABC transporter substrate-binding protein [Shouchella clausii]AST96156.1 ABC transporter substrate-binding protein [Shouchella clausii]MCR1288940.1 sugar ABC transporter substrate-binding protein [Shouchella clausii]MEB5471402.1 sugar ABC transporter substrate-binding protein [Shouchella clausii]QNM42512.1 sugar ABC transporter substrate-binding protein [Shouchella clausii]WQG94637.1 sugar ABC transporter substrate-binding protein [Shouchella clausii]